MARLESHICESIIGGSFMESEMVRVVDAPRLYVLNSLFCIQFC